MTQRSYNIAVGLTMLLSLLGLAFMVFQFNDVPRWVEGSYVVTIELPDSGGIHADASVYLNGITVGRVETIKLHGPPQYQVTATARIRRNVRLPIGVRAQVNRPPIGGSARLKLDLSGISADRSQQWLPTDGTAVVHGEALDVASQFARSLSETMAEPIRQIGQVTKRFEELSQQWIEVGMYISQLVAPRSTEQVDHGSTTGNLATVLARADQRLAELRVTLEGMNQWVNDSQLRQDARTTAANARNLTQRYFALADDLSNAVASIKQMIDDAHHGQGTIGKLIHVPDLYNNLNDTVERFGVMADELKLLIQKWKAEGLPIQF